MERLQRNPADEDPSDARRSEREQLRLPLQQAEDSERAEGRADGAVQHADDSVLASELRLRRRPRTMVNGAGVRAVTALRSRDMAGEQGRGEVGERAGVDVSQKGRRACTRRQ